MHHRKLHNNNDHEHDNYNHHNHYEHDKYDHHFNVDHYKYEHIDNNYDYLLLDHIYLDNYLHVLDNVNKYDNDIYSQYIYYDEYDIYDNYFDHCPSMHHARQHPSLRCSLFV